MSPPTGFLRGTRAFIAAARYTSTRSKTVVSAAAPAKETSASKSAKLEKEKKVPSGGITKVLPISQTLQSFVGEPEISRVQAVKKVWEYIKLNKLQNPTNKKEIVCDAKLKKVFNGKDKVDMLEIAKLLSSHFVKN